MSARGAAGRTLRRTASGLGLGLGLRIVAAVPAGAATLAVFKSRDLLPYERAIEGLASRLTSLELEIHDMEGDAEKGQELYEQARARNPEAFVAVGTLALRLLSQETEIPVVFTMVGHPTRHFDVDMENVTGVSLDNDPVQQFRQLKELLPDARNVGVLYNRELSGEDVDRAHDAAEAEGLTLFPVEVDSPKEVPKALRSFGQPIDALWLLPNRTALTERALEYVVIEMTKRKTPILGASGRYTKAGALFSLDAIHGEIGEQTGDLVERVLGSRRPAREHAIESPGRLSLTLNLKTASLLGLPVDAQVEERARVVIK